MPSLRVGEDHGCQIVDLYETSLPRSVPPNVASLTNSIYPTCYKKSWSSLSINSWQYRSL